MITTINPATGAKIRSYEEMTTSEVAELLQRVGTAQTSWAKETFSRRSDLMRNAATILRKNKRTYATLMATEMGKPLAAGGAEIEKCAWVCEYYANEALVFLAPQTIESTATKSFVAFEPLGVILAIMPWNFPFWQVFRFAAPALMAGNGGVLKHASATTGCALAIEEVFATAGFPSDIFRTLCISSHRMDGVIEHPAVAAVTLTGSEPAGISVAKRAGAVLKKTVLELGGSDPYVVLADADLTLAAETCVRARLQNTGQTCIAAKRFIVVEPVLKAFTEKVIAAMRPYTVGDPLDPNVMIGPMAQQGLRDELQQQVDKSVALGAHCVMGGKIPAGQGFYYPPTLLTNVVPGMPVFDEETFGPVAVIVTATDEEDAIRLANLTAFGLGASVFTRDLEKGREIAQKKLNAGCCFVNDFVKSDPRLPFGGIKRSGYGRELADFGIREFVNVKTVFVK